MTAAAQHIRIGQGYDLHRLVNRTEEPTAGPLIVGGVDISAAMGTVAHSDGDVVLHALIDALLGALALGDIGDHFPPSDARYANVDSATLLADVLAMVTKHKASIINVDSTIFLEKPKLGNNKQKIRQRLAELLGLTIEQVSVKAKTMEQLGAIGQGQAIAVSVSVLLNL